MPIPQADQAAYNRMKWEKANYKKPSMLYRATDLIRRGPDVSCGRQIRCAGDDQFASDHSGQHSATRRLRRWGPPMSAPVWRNRFEGSGYQAGCASESARGSSGASGRDRTGGSRWSEHGSWHGRQTCRRCQISRIPSRSHTNRCRPTTRRRRLRPARRSPRRPRLSKQRRRQRLPRIQRPRLSTPPARRYSEAGMSRILLADDSPHAQRMGERILREEGFEVVSLTDGENTLLRLADVDPDLILADVFLPNKLGPGHLPLREKPSPSIATCASCSPRDCWSRSTKAKLSSPAPTRSSRSRSKRPGVMQTIKPLLAEAQAGGSAL
jgi:hypothetical protein